MIRARYTTVVMIVTGHGVNARGFLGLWEAMIPVLLELEGW
jgi:hypothetical protein